MREVSHWKHWISLTYALLGAHLVLIIVTFSEYGITYDEDWHYTYGEHIIQWYASGFRDTSALTYWTLPLQAGFFGVVSRLATRISPLGVFETGHLMNALLGFLGVVGAYKLGRMLAGPLAGFLSALFLLASPRFYGHMFSNAVDIPMAAFSVIAVYHIVRMVHCLPRVPIGLILKLGAVMGLALAARVGAIILVGYVGVAMCLWLVRQHLLGSAWVQPNSRLRSDILRLAGAFVAMCTVAYVIMLAWWPAAQVRPFVQPAKGLLYATRFGYKIDVLFEGELVSNDDLPWYYVSKWFLITLPEFYFMALVAGLVQGVTYIARTQKAPHALVDERTLGIVILLVFIALPVVYTLLTAPVDYDGVRHFLFIIPPLAVLAAISVAELVERGASSLATGAAIMAILASVCVTVIDMVQLHPYQYVFFNRAFGKGMAEAARSYDTDYWGSSYKEGVEWLVSNYHRGNNGERPKVASCSYFLSTAYYLPDDRFEYVGSYHDGQQIPEGTEPDVLLATPRWDCHRTLPGKVLHTVTRKGAILLYIIEVDARLLHAQLRVEQC